MSEPPRGRVVHVLPGRVRVRVERDQLGPGGGQELQSALEALAGVEHVRVNPNTGSILIRYDASQLDVRGLLQLAEAANLLALDALSGDPYGQRVVPVSLTSQRVLRTFHEVDVRLSDLSEGRWDLRTVVPFAFGALALRAIVRDFSSLAGAPWYVLAWYAFDSFWKLNQDRPRPDSASAPTSNSAE